MKYATRGWHWLRLLCKNTREATPVWLGSLWGTQWWWHSCILIIDLFDLGIEFKICSAWMKLTLSPSIQHCNLDISIICNTRVVVNNLNWHIWIAIHTVNLEYTMRSIHVYATKFTQAREFVVTKAWEMCPPLIHPYIQTSIKRQLESWQLYIYDVCLKIACI